MRAPAIEFCGVAKSRGGQATLAGVDLAVEAGECLGLVGVNGAGKTTLIKCLLDLDQADSGRIAIFGQSHHFPQARKGLAYLPEKFQPPGHLRGWEFLRGLGKLHGHGFDPDEAGEVLRQLDLEPAALDKPAARLSKGMAQKLGLAACLLNGKRALVMDEPMSGLDPRARAGLRHCLLALKQQGRACFFSTHLLHDLEGLCDRMAILHQGRIRYAGAPEACRQRFKAPDLEQAYLRCVAAGRAEADRNEASQDSRKARASA